MLKTTVKFLILAVTCCSLGVGVKSYSFQNRAMRALAGVSVVTSLGLFAPMVVMDAEAKVGSEKLTRFYEAQEELKNIDSNFVDITTRVSICLCLCYAYVCVCVIDNIDVFSFTYH